jgi:predicted N-formylglutamate amidohydrolase
LYPVPPFAVSVIVDPAHTTVPPLIVTLNTGAEFTVTDADPLQPFASVAVTLTAPAVDTVIEGVFAPVDHE